MERKDNGFGFMINREELIISFLKKIELSGAKREPIASDASFRRYERIKTNNRSFMLMDAPPVREDVKPFINIDKYLRGVGLSAPEIYAADEKNGFILLEDYGDDSFSNVLAVLEKSKKYSEKKLYLSAMDVLIRLSSSGVPGNIPHYDNVLLANESRLLTEWYLPNIKIDTHMNKAVDKAVDEYVSIWDELLTFNKISDDVIVLRDFHADNLMWLPDRAGPQNVGLLDFQDAVIGSCVYDIISLLEDARRDVSKDTVNACIEYYLDASKSIDKQNFMKIYAILAAQRNCKIIGIFARLALRDGKVRYLNYLPRVWRHLENGLNNLALERLKIWFDNYIPKSCRHSSLFSSAQKEAVVG